MYAISLKHNENAIVPNESFFNSFAKNLPEEEKLFKFSPSNEIQQIKGIKVYKTGRSSELCFEHEKIVRSFFFTYIFFSF